MAYGSSRIKISKTEKAEIIDRFMNDTRSNSFDPHAFLNWLKDKPEIKCWPMFFGMSDEQAAWEHRASMVRKWVSNMRITVRTDSVPPDTITAAPVTHGVEHMPMMISVRTERVNGFSYAPTDPTDPRQMRELTGQAADALAAAHERYAAAARRCGVDMNELLPLIGRLKSAAAAGD